MQKKGLIQNKYPTKAYLKKIAYENSNWIHYCTFIFHSLTNIPVKKIN